MNLLAKLLLAMHVMAMRRRDRWPRDRLVAFQQARLASLARFVRARSPHYARVLAGLDEGPAREATYPHQVGVRLPVERRSY